MKKIYLLLVIGLLTSPIQLLAKKVEGKIIFENDTLEVVFDIPTNIFTKQPDYEKLQYRVKYVDSEGKKMVLKSDKAKEIQFKIGEENVRMLSRINTLGSGMLFSTNRNIFLKLEDDGILKLFKFFYTQRNTTMPNSPTGVMMGGSSYSQETYMLQKGEGELKKPKFLSFKKDMAAYLSDCPSMVEKIEIKDFRYNDIPSMVEYYNSNCGNQ